MIQRPRTTASGLKEEDHKKLISELTKYAEEGASDSELKEFRETFISQKKNSIQNEKVSSVSNMPQPQKRNTTVLPSEDGSLDTQRTKKELKPGDKGYEPASIQNALGFTDDSALYKAGHWVNALMNEGTVEVLKFADNVVNSAKNSLRDEKFFDDDVPDTQSPITDAVKNTVVKRQASKNQLVETSSPFDPREISKGIGDVLSVVGSVASKIINSSLSHEQKKSVISALASGSSGIKDQIKNLENYQEKYLDESIVTKSLRGISGMTPDLVVAQFMGNAAPLEKKAAQATAKIAEETMPLIQKYAPKAIKFVEEAVKAPFTKIMATKGAFESMANAEEGESVMKKAVEGGLQGGFEGMYMHGLGVAAGKFMPIIAKGVGTTGVKTAWSTAIANPLANAGVFTTARALRTGIEEQRLITPEEAAMEATTGVGFSLLHAGSLYKNHKQLDYYYTETLKDEPIHSIGRVINETKDNLDAAYKPNLTNDQVKNLMDARDEIKSAILKEPDLNKKQLLGNVAVKIQGQLDAAVGIKTIVEHKDAIIDAINQDTKLDDNVKDEKIRKVSAIADHFDTSEYGLKKKELNTKINEAQKNLDDASLGFTNLKIPSEREEAKLKIEEKRKELEGLNTELTDLITNKNKQDAIQKQGADESVLRTEQPELGLQEVGEGNAKPKILTEEEITAEKQKIEDERNKAIDDYYTPENEESVVTNPIYSSIEKQIRDPKKRLFEDEQAKTLKALSLMMDAGMPHKDIIEKLNKKFDYLDLKYNETEIDRINDKYDEQVRELEKPAEETVVAEEISAEKPQAPKDYKTYFDQDIPNMTVQENNGEFLIGNYTPASEGKNPSMKPVTDLEGNPLTFKTQEEAQAKLDEVQVKPKETPLETQPITQEDLEITESEDGFKIFNNKTNLYEEGTDEQGIAPSYNTKEEAQAKLDEIVSSKTQTAEQLTQTKENEQATAAGEPATTLKPEPVAGNRLFNKPLEAVKTVADRYYKRVFGKEREKFSGKRKIDEAKLKRLSDAFISMEHNPNDPEVKAAYEALAKETIDQYQEFLDAGYTIDFKDKEPYKNSQEMIDDLRNNKHISILSTEAEFGNEPITEQQRIENPLLKDSGFKDANGNTLLINDVFRAIHDFYGHAELGNSFGPKGEENAWNVHARMYSELARRAMTMETRAQNAFVNFSGINEKIEGLREEARKLRESGDEEGAQKIVEQIYKDGMFGPQKIGLVDKEFSNIDEGDAGDISMRPEGLNLREAVQVEEVSPIQEFGTQGLSEAELKGYDRMMNEVEGIVAKTKERLRREPLTDREKNKKLSESVIGYVQGSKAYENATDVQREQLIRDVRKRFGLREKAAPSVARLFGTLKDVKKITMTEKAALVKQIKDLGRGAKDAVRAWKLASQELSKNIKELADGGKINSTQAANVLRAFSKTNVFSETSVSRFTNYMTKVFADAEYADQLSSAKKIKSDISKLSKDKNKDVNLTDLAAKFTKIDPSMVDDIYEYNDMASKIKEAVKGSTIRGQKIKWADTVNVKDAIEFTKKTIEIQEEKIRDERIAELESLMGVDASDFTDAEIKVLLEKEKNFTEDDDKILRATAKKAFDIYSSVIKEVIETGKDSFTGEDINYDKNQKKLIKKFMDMDLDILNTNEVVNARDALLNFLVNKSTARMGLVVEQYAGKKNIKELVNDGIKSRPLRKYGSPLLGRLLADEITTLSVLFEKMFPGFNRSGKVMEKLGIQKVIQENDQSITEGNNIVNEYVEKFFDKEANGEEFNTKYNNTERDMAAYMIRSIDGTPEEIQKEFDDRRNLIEESIEALKKGNVDEQEKSEIYQEAYDKILKDSKNAEEVLNKTDKTNVDAINFYINKFGDKFNKISDVSESIYNIKLEKDINYTPDKVSKLSNNLDEIELDDNDSAYHNNNGSIIVKKAGSLNEIKRLSKLPKGKYVNLSFDKNMANSMYDVLIDINTAAPIQRVKAAINSPEFQKLVPHIEDAKILRGDKRERMVGRIELYIKNMRNKNPYSNDQLSKGMKNINRLSNIGVGQALAGVTQPFKQVIPVALNTFINADGNLNLGAGFNADKIAFINNSGYGIANRGRQSLAEIETVNKLIEKASLSKGQKFVKAIEDINELQLKYLLEKPDVFIAKMSWLTYYEQSLKKQGIDTNKLDYKDLKINKEAADYAERQTTRQQNLNNRDLAGRFYTSKNAYAQIFSKMLMSFSSFRMNSSARFGADLITLQDKTSSKEDRKLAVKSIAGYGVEMAAFRGISIAAALMIGTLAKKYLGKDESEKEYQKRKNNLLKGAATGVVTDIFSPIPILDPLVQKGGAKFTEAIEGLTGAPVSIYDVPKQEFLKQYGTFGITADRIGKLWDLGNLAATGKYKDDFGRTKKISNDDMESLRPLVPLFVATSVGILPVEINSGINNAVKFSKKKSSGSVSMEELKKSDPKLYEKIKKMQEK